MNSKNSEKTSLIQNETQSNLNISNPIENKKILSLNTITSANRLYGGYANAINKKQEINFKQLTRALNSCFVNQSDSIKLFYDINKHFSNILSLNYCAIGLYNENSRGVSLPVNTISDEMLQSALDKAIADENYELASHLRDEKKRRNKGENNDSK